MMNWDTTELQANGVFSSKPLTVTGIERTRRPFLSNNETVNRVLYSIKVKEDVTYWKEIGGDKTVEKVIATFQRTHKNRNQLSDDRNDAFYYFAYHFRSKNSVEIPFKGYWFNTDFTGIAFCLSEEANEIIKEEKKRWDNAKLTKEEDLKIESIGFIDAKWDALKKDINGDNWSPSLNEEEKKLIDEAKTTEEVREAQRKIALLREQKKQDNKQNSNEIEELKKQLTEKKGQIEQKQKELDQTKKDKEKSEKDYEQEKGNREQAEAKLGNYKKENEDLKKQIDDYKQNLLGAEKELQKEKERSGANDGKIAQLLDIRRKDLNVRLAKFRTDLSIRENDLQAKYASLDYQQILDKSLTLDNLNQLENTIRTVICICATEIISQEVNSKKANSDEIRALLTELNLIKTAWSQTASEISKENNPLYLEIIDQQSERRQQVENLIETLQKQQPQTPILEDLSAIKQQAKQDIEKALAGASLSKEDIISDYQKYAEKIEQLTDSQEVKKFVQAMTAYIGRQEAAHKELREVLKNAVEVSSEDKNKEEGIFEKRRQARQKLDELSEKISPEAKQTYQVINKNSEVTNSINKLYGLIEAYLAKYKEKAKERIGKIMEENSSKKEFLQALKEGTPRFDLYCTVWGIVERYIKDKLGKEVDVYPYITEEGSNGHTSWKEDHWPTHYNKKFDFNISFDSINVVSLEKNFDRAEVMLLATVAHELSHDKTMREETEGSFKRKRPQWHSDYFWRNFRHGSLFETESTATYVCSCLSSEKRKKLKDYVFDPSVPNHPHIRYLYFPNADYSAIKVPENERKKKWFSKDQGGIADIYESTWTKLFEFVDSSLSKVGWKKEEIEKHWVKIWLKQPHEIKNKDEKKDFKIYIYYKNDISENLKNLIDTEFSGKNEWEQETIHEDKIKKIADRVCASAEHGTCEEGEFQQTAQIIHNPMGNPNK